MDRTSRNLSMVEINAFKFFRQSWGDRTEKIDDHGIGGDFDIYSTDAEGGPVTDVYRGYTKKKGLAILVAALLLLLALVIAAQNGPIRMGFMEVAKYIFTLNTDGSGHIVWNIRMVRILGAVLAGAGLALAGTVMQCILRNPLASPYTLGLSSAAAFGASFAIIYLGAGSSLSSGITISNPYLTTLCAFASSLVAIAAILALTRLVGISSETMVLAGIAMSAMYTAALSYLQFIATDSQLGNIVSWTFGDMGKATWSFNMMVLSVLLPSTLYFYYRRWDYNAMEAGEDSAKGLGVNTSRERTIGMLLASLLSAVIVSFFGIIAFVGLLGPHIARMMIGGDHRYLIPMSMLIGSLILVSADGLGLVIQYPIVIPVGIITSMLGGPLFIYLLIRRYRH